MIDFISAVNTVNQKSQFESIGEQETTALAQLETHDMAELITSPQGEYSPKVREAIGRSKILRIFAEKLQETNRVKLMEKVYLKKVVY